MYLCPEEKSKIIRLSINSQTKCPQWISISSDRDCESTTQQFPALFKKISSFYIFKRKGLAHEVMKVWDCFRLLHANGVSIHSAFRFLRPDRTGEESNPQGPRREFLAQGVAS